MVRFNCQRLLKSGFFIALARSLLVVFLRLVNSLMSLGVSFD